MSVQSRSPDVKPLMGLIGLGVFSLCTAAAAQAEDCQLRIEGIPPSVQIDYDPFVLATAPARMAFRVHNPTDSVCQADLALVGMARNPLNRLEMARTGLKLELRPAQAVSRSPVPAIFALKLAGGETTEASFDVAVTDDAVVPSGRYSEPMTLELRQPGSGVAYERAPVVFDLISLPRAQMNLSGSRGDFGTGASVSVVDFGPAQTGKQRQLFVQTRANNPARLTFRSANQGRLKLMGQGDEARSLDYSVAFDGHALDLKQTAVRNIDPPRTFAGQSFDLILTLGRVEGAQAGTYNDELTIEISTL